MSALHRFIPPALVPVNGQPALSLPGVGNYSCAAGSHMDAPFGQALLNLNAWIDLGECGPSSARPTPNAQPGAHAELGRRFIDTTLGTVIFWNGESWVDLNGASV